MPPEIQRLREAAELWREQHKAVDGRWAALAAELDPVGAQAADLELRALTVAIKAADLCISRGVVPRLEAPDRFVIEVVIPPRPRAFASESTIELIRHSHDPVTVECELDCASTHAALDLVDAALRASIFTRGWAPLFVRLWVQLLGQECERALATPLQKHDAPRLVVASEQEDEPA